MYILYATALKSLCLPTMRLMSGGVPLPTAHPSPGLSALTSLQLLVLQGFLDGQASPGQAYTLIHVTRPWACTDARMSLLMNTCCPYPSTNSTELCNFNNLLHVRKYLFRRDTSTSTNETFFTGTLQLLPLNQDSGCPQIFHLFSGFTAGTDCWHICS